MLVIELAGKNYFNKPAFNSNTPPWYPPSANAEIPRSTKVMFEEAKRRNKIVKEAAAKCPFKVGDTCIPRNKKDYEEYGSLVIEQICTSYAQYGKEVSWNDDPLIITALSQKTGSRLFCNISYLLTKPSKTT